MSILTNMAAWRRPLIWLAIVTIAGAGAYLRFLDLESDPPLYFTGQAQSLSTDAHHYSYFARSKILFDQWEPFDSEKWRVFKLTLSTGLNYLIFSMFGVSRYNANLTGVLISLLSILIFLLALRRFTSLTAVFLALVFLMFNKVLFVYGQLPYTENGMILIMCLLFYIFVRYRESLWGKIVLGFLAGLSALAGKIFGIIIILPLLFCIFYENEPGRFKKILPVCLSCFVTVALWMFLFYGKDLGLLLDYYTAQTIGQYGAPQTLLAPIGFFERLISFGNDSRFYYNAPALGLAGFLAFLIILYSRSKIELKQKGPIIFMIGWLVVCQLIFSPENYRPLRYIYMLYFPLAGLVAGAFSMNMQNGNKSEKRKSYFFYIAIFFLFWIFIDQLVFNIFFDNQFGAFHQKLVWYSAPAAVVITLFEIKFRFIRFVTNKYFKTILVSLIVIYALWNFQTDYLKWQKHKSYNIMEASRDIAEVTSQNAVICGPLAPSLLLENNLQGVIYGSGLTDRDTSFLGQYPITHFIVEEDRSWDIVKKFPALIKADAVSPYWICDHKYVLARISDLTGNKEAALYQLTDFEVGRLFMEKKEYDSAVYYLEYFHKQHPANKSVLLALGKTYPFLGRLDEAESILKKAVLLYPRDYSVYVALGFYYHVKYAVSGETQFLRDANDTYQQVLNINPFQIDVIEATPTKIAGYK